MWNGWTTPCEYWCVVVNHGLRVFTFTRLSRALEYADQHASRGLDAAVHERRSFDFVYRGQAS